MNLRGWAVERETVIFGREYTWFRNPGGRLVLLPWHRWRGARI